MPGNRRPERLFPTALRLRQGRRCTHQLAAGRVTEAVTVNDGMDRSKGNMDTLQPETPRPNRSGNLPKQLRGIYKMRKSLVLALALVLAIAGASFAATPQFSGSLEVTATSQNSFAGPFGVTYGAELGIKFEEEGENWTANVGLAAVDLSTGGNFALGSYKGTFAGDGFDVAVARNQSVGGKKGDPFDFYVLTDKPRGDDHINRIRLTTSVLDQEVLVQLASDTDELRVRTEGSVEAFDWGVTAGVDLDDTSAFGFVFDGAASFGIADVYGAAGSVHGDTVYGVGADFQLTEEFSADAQYKHDAAGNDTWKVGAKYEEGLLQATAGYNNDEVATVGAKYRGDAGNQSFNNLFAKDHYWKNVAPAFGGSFTTKDNKITLDATAPLADNFAVKGQVVVEEGKDTAINLDARYAVNDKFTIEPYYASADEKFGSDFKYAVGEGASIALNVDSEGGNQSSFVKFSIDF